MLRKNLWKIKLHNTLPFAQIVVNYSVIRNFGGNGMKLTQKIKWNYLTLAFLVPFVGMLFVMIVSGYEPFGKYSMLYSDMYHQY